MNPSIWRTSPYHQEHQWKGKGKANLHPPAPTRPSIPHLPLQSPQRSPHPILRLRHLHRARNTPLPNPNLLPPSILPHRQPTPPQHILRLLPKHPHQPPPKHPLHNPRHLLRPDNPPSPPPHNPLQKPQHRPPRLPHPPPIPIPQRLRKRLREPIHQPQHPRNPHTPLQRGTPPRRDVPLPRRQRVQHNRKPPRRAGMALPALGAGEGDVDGHFVGVLPTADAEARGGCPRAEDGAVVGGAEDGDRVGGEGGGGGIAPCGEGEGARDGVVRVGEGGVEGGEEFVEGWVEVG